MELVSKENDLMVSALTRPSMRLRELLILLLLLFKATSVSSILFSSSSLLRERAPVPVAFEGTDKEKEEEDAKTLSLGLSMQFLSLGLAFFLLAAWISPTSCFSSHVSVCRDTPYFCPDRAVSKTHL